MRRHSFASITLLYTAFLLLTGCASLGLEPAQNFDERLAYAVSQNAGVRLAAAASFQAGDIEKEDAQFALKMTDEARTLLDAARIASNAGDLSTAQARVTLALSVLTELQNHLRSRSKK